MFCFTLFKKRNLYNQLLQTTNEGKLFSFNEKIIYAKCTDVYDGDTITVKFFYNGELYKYKVRFYGLDTPEMKSKNLVEKSFGTVSKEVVQDMVLNKLIKLKCYEFDKYGRMMADIYVKTADKEIQVNEFLIANKYAVKYFGDTKQEFNPENFNNEKINIPVSMNYSLMEYIKN
jgi:endonuclease YncB( thermonuclease family)